MEFLQRFRGTPFSSFTKGFVERRTSCFPNKLKLDVGDHFLTANKFSEASSFLLLKEGGQCYSNFVFDSKTSTNNETCAPNDWQLFISLKS